MPFPTQPARVPAALGHISYTVDDPDGIPAKRTISATIEILDQDGQRMGVWAGNIAPHLLAGEINGQQSFATAVRTRAAAQLLP